jgi:hypothetical protein
VSNKYVRIGSIVRATVVIKSDGIIHANVGDTGIVEHIEEGYSPTVNWSRGTGTGCFGPLASEYVVVGYAPPPQSIRNIVKEMVERMLATEHPRALDLTLYNGKTAIAWAGGTLFINDCPVNRHGDAALVNNAPYIKQLYEVVAVDKIVDKLKNLQLECLRLVKTSDDKPFTLRSGSQFIIRGESLNYNWHVSPAGRINLSEAPIKLLAEIVANADFILERERRLAFEQDGEYTDAVKMLAGTISLEHK